MKRYYPFGEEAEECWRNSPNLRKLLNPKWLKTQAQNQLLWDVHPLFYDICVNPDAIFALEEALKSSTNETQKKIKKKLKSLRNDTNKNKRNRWFGFLAEIFILLRLQYKGVEYEYNPGKPGADFTLSAPLNTAIEVTSIQTGVMDGLDEAWSWWRICLQQYNTGLSLYLTPNIIAKLLKKTDWIEGCEYFKKYVNEHKNLKKDDKLILENLDSKQLASLKINRIGNHNITAVTPIPGATTRSANVDHMIRTFFMKFSNIIDDKSKQMKKSDRSSLICVNTSTWGWRQRGVWGIPLEGFKDFCAEEIQEKLSQSDYDSIAGFILFQRNLDKKDISILRVIPNPNSTLAKENRQLFQKTLDIFR